MNATAFPPSTGVGKHRFSVCGVECENDYAWMDAGEILLAAYAKGAMAVMPRDPGTPPDPHVVHYTLGCSETGEEYPWSRRIDLTLYGGDPRASTAPCRRFFILRHGHTRAT